MCSPNGADAEHLAINDRSFREVRIWARKRHAPVLAVPSVVVPAELDYLINPLHPDFRRIKLGKPQEFQTDLRLIEALRV